MSRCFPFPPPGYMRNGTCNETLIESIKLRRGSEKSKKERKKEKKVKKKERKETKETKQKAGKAINACLGEDKLFKPNDVEYNRLEKIGAETGACFLQKGDDDENEQLEKSGITEEHDQPVSSRERCCLSDSTQSSNKRKRRTPPSNQDHGTVIIIRLPLRKHREPEEPQHDDQLGITSGSVESVRLPQCVTKAETYPCVGNSDSEQCEALQSSIQETDGVNAITNLPDNGERRMASAYNSLFQNWVPPPLTLEGIESCDWLFRTEVHEEMPVSKKVKYVADSFRRSSPSLYPLAQYIPEVEIFALPYTLPF